jgi:hypothetical protein
MTDTTAVVRIPEGCRPIGCIAETKEGALGVLMAAQDWSREALQEVITAIGYLALRFGGESGDALPVVWFRERAFVQGPGDEKPA